MTPLLENRRFPLSQHTIGPFFPADYFQPGDNDLTRVSPSANPCSTGEHFTLTGAVRKEGSEPVANAILELWQADASGRFRHSEDPQGDQADPDFLGWGRAWSTAEGAYSFHSVRPGPYDENGKTRAPHLNILVMGIGLMRIVETTLFFPNFPAENAKDPVLSVLRQRIRPSFVFLTNSTAPRFQMAGHDAMVRIAQNAKNSQLSEVIFAWMAPANILSARAVVRGYLEITWARLP